MDASSLPSFDSELDQMFKMDSGALQQWMGIPSPGLSMPTLNHIPMPESPTGVLHNTLPPIITLPTDATFASDSGSGLAAGEEFSPRAATGPPAKKQGSKVAELSDEQKNRVRAKNRRAQDRYRNKKKAEREAKAEAVEQIASDVERLRLENERLTRTNGLMENVLVVRDAWASVLQQNKDEAEAQGDHRVSLPAVLQRLRGPGPSAAQLCKEESGCPLTGLSQSEVAAVKAMAPEVFMEHFKGIVHRLRDALVVVDDPKALPQMRDTANAEMKEVLWEAGCMCFEHSAVNPTNMQRLLAASVDDGAVSSSSEEEHARRWADITRMLELTPEQRAGLVPMRTVFLQKRARVMEARKAALVRLQAAALPADVEALQAASWLQANEATVELSANLQEEHVVCMQLVQVFGTVLTPLQKARAIVASFPAFPDVYALTTAALAEMMALEGGSAPSDAALEAALP